MYELKGESSGISHVASFRTEKRDCCCIEMFRGISQYFKFKIEAKVASRSIPFFPEERPTHPLDHPSHKTHPRHASWSAVLRKHITRRKICSIQTNALDYTALATDPEFFAYLAQLAHPGALDGLSHTEELALWINAYNALCAGLIVRHFNIEGKLPSSITNLTNSKDGPVWDQPAGQVGGRVYSLGEIEHEVIRRRWRTPLVHACLVCASSSCPDLRTQAYEAGTLQTQMADQMSSWLSNASKGASMLNQDEVVMSRIFLWYYPDFGADRFDAVEFARAMGAPLKQTPSRLSYYEYDWSLNHGDASVEPTKDEDSCSVLNHTPKL